MAVGAEASVVRAALMFTVVLFAPLASRRAVSLNVLGGVGIALLGWRPGDLLDPSFQLTFVSVLAIVIVAWPLLEKCRPLVRGDQLVRHPTHLYARPGYDVFVRVSSGTNGKHNANLTASTIATDSSKPRWHRHWSVCISSVCCDTCSRRSLFPRACSWRCFLFSSSISTDYRSLHSC